MYVLPDAVICYFLSPLPMNNFSTPTLILATFVRANSEEPIYTELDVCSSIILYVFVRQPGRD